MSNPKCLDCPHLHDNHNMDDDGDRRCRMTILTGWSQEQNTFLHSRPCDCPGYSGPDPEIDACACEFVASSPNCVHCGKVRVQ